MQTVKRQRQPFFGGVQNFYSRAGAPPSIPADAAVEEKVFSLFQPDVLLFHQYLETTRRKTYRDPEKKLLLAVLEDAVLCFQTGLLAKDKRKRGLFSEAEDWIMEEDGDWLFSFDSVCELLGLNPRYMRKQLLRWKREALSGRVKVKVYRITHIGERGEKPVSEAGEKRRRFLKAAGF